MTRRKTKDVGAMGVVVPIRPTSQRNTETPGGDASDGELVIAAIDGAAWAKEALYRRHVSMATGLAHRVLGGTDVDDLVQDAYLAAFRGLPRLEAPQAFAKFLGSIVIRTARRRIRHRRMLRRIGFGHGEPVDVERIVSRSAPPDVGAELRSIYAILEELPTDVRIALVLRRVEGQTISEIADHMQISPATVKRRISAGEVMLTKRLSRCRGSHE